MATRFENTIKVSVPSIREEVAKIPNVRGKLYGEDGWCRDQFLRCFQAELHRCVTEALRVSEGKVFFSDLRVPDMQTTGQFIMQFEVFDLGKPRGNAYNFHGQNTSQWVYAGAIVYQNGWVSTHH